MIEGAPYCAALLAQAVMDLLTTLNCTMTGGRWVVAICDLR